MLLGLDVEGLVCVGQDGERCVAALEGGGLGSKGTVFCR